MVGGLVEDEEVDRLEQQFYHRQTAALTSRQHFDFLVGGLTAKHKGPKYVADFQAYVATRYAVDGVEHGEFTVEQLGLILGAVANLDIVTYFEFAGKVYLIHYTLDQRGLSLTIAPHKSHLLAAAEGERDVVKDTMTAIILAHFIAD